MERGFGGARVGHMVGDSWEFVAQIYIYRQTYIYIYIYFFLYIHIA